MGELNLYMGEGDKSRKASGRVMSEQGGTRVQGLKGPNINIYLHKAN